MFQQSSQCSTFDVQKGPYTVTTGVCLVYTRATLPGRSAAYSHCSSFVKNLAWEHSSFLYGLLQSWFVSRVSQECGLAVQSSLELLNSISLQATACCQVLNTSRESRHDCTCKPPKKHDSHAFAWAMCYSCPLAESCANEFTLRQAC